MSGRLVILGGKESGVGAAILGKAKGWEVFVSDNGTIPDRYLAQLAQHQIPFEAGEHTREKILNADLVVKSPGIPEKAGLIQELRAKKVKIVSEIEFASRYTTGKIIAITGANGKTTVTSMVYEMLRHQGVDVGLGGNIGESFALQVANGDHDYFVLEVSSFQLDDIDTFKPWIAVLTNITPDHLDRYEYKIENYAASKYRITENQTAEDYFIYCLDDEITLSMMPEGLKAQKLGFSLEKKENSVAWTEGPLIQIEVNSEITQYNYNQMQLEGKHNIYNTMAAGIIGSVMDLRKDTVRESFADFQSIEHRLEKVLVVRGIEFINDSKATNVNSAWYALESINKPIIWIAGGVDKGNDYSILVPLVEKKVKAIVAIGKDVRKIHQAFGPKVPMIMHVESMEEAIDVSYHLGDKGDCVLLSPACASFDLFEDYQDRGRRFKAAVRQL